MKGRIIVAAVVGAFFLAAPSIMPGNGGGLAATDAMTPASVASTGQISTTLNPANTTNTSASVLVNPAACASNEPLLGVLVNGTSKAIIDCEGDSTWAGTMIVTGNNTTGYLQITGSNPYMDLYQATFGHFYFQVYTSATGQAVSGNYVANIAPSGKHFTFVDGTTQRFEINSAGYTLNVGQFAPGSTPQTQTCADVGGAGASAVTVNPTSATVIITNNDVLGGCVATVAESNAVASSRVLVCSDIASQATTITFADQAGLFNGGASHATGLLPGNCFDMSYFDSQWNAVTAVNVN